MSEDGLGGVLPVIATPFAADWSVDAHELRREIDWLFANGAQGLTVAMVSEIQRLSPNERMELNGLAIAHADGRGPVVVSVGAESTVQSVRLARQARVDGADAVMAAPPLLGAIPTDELRRYVHEIALAADLPVVLQDASGYVGTPIPAVVQARLVRELGPERLYLKPESEPLGPTVSAIMAASDGTARIFDGSGGIALLDTFARGIVGTMPGPDLVWAVRALWDAALRNDLRRATEITAPLSAMISMAPGLDGYVAFEKHMLRKQSVLSSERMRGPVTFTLDAPTREIVDSLYTLLLAATTPIDA